MKALIIGSGLAGVTSAYFLSEQGVEVTVLERADGVARETSFANGSMITPSLADPWNAPGALGVLLKSLGREDAPMMLRMRALPALIGWGLAFLRNSSRARFEDALLRNVRLIHYSQAVMRDVQQRHVLRFDHAADGTMEVFRDQASMAAGIAAAGFLADEGIEHRVLDHKGVVRHEPALADVADDLVGGIAFPRDEVGNAQRFCEELCRVAEAAGTTFEFGVEVSGFRRDGPRVSAVETNRGVWRADVIVMAAGSYSEPLLRQLGVPLPVRPAKGYSITVPLAGWSPAPHIPVVDHALHAAVVPVGENLRVAGTAEFAGFDTSIAAGRIDNLRGLLRRLYPAFEAELDDGDVIAWAGLRPMSVDSVPVLGRCPIDNLFLNTGHGHLGWSMACGSGKIVADLATGQTPDIDVAPYGYFRF